MQQLGQPKFRAKQIFQWLHQKRVLSFDEMKNIPASLREQLAEQCRITSFTIERKLVSAVDGTIKYLYRLADGEYVESVLMRYEHGISVCVFHSGGMQDGMQFLCFDQGRICPASDPFGNPRAGVRTGTGYRRKGGQSGADGHWGTAG